MNSLLLLQIAALNKYARENQPLRLTFAAVPALDPLFYRAWHTCADVLDVHSAQVCWTPEAPEVVTVCGVTPGSVRVVQVRTLSLDETLAAELLRGLTRLAQLKRTDQLLWEARPAMETQAQVDVEQMLADVAQASEPAAPLK